MDSTLIYFIGLSVLIVVGVTLFAVRKSKQNKQTLNALSATLGTTEISSGSEYRGELEGQTYYYQYHAGNRNSPSHFKLWVECESSGEFTVGKESRFDALAKRLGIAEEIQTGDKPFDEDFYIQTDSNSFTRNYFLNPDKRQSVKSLYDSGFNLLKHNGKTMEATISPFSIDRFDNNGLIQDAIRDLSALSRDLPADYYQRRMLGTHAWKAARNIIYIIAGSSIALGFAGIFWGLKTYTPLDGFDMFLFSLQYSIAALASFTLASVLLIRGRSSSHKELSIAFLLSLVGIPMTGFSLVIVLNGYLDESEIRHHDARVTARRLSKSKNSTSYYVSLDSWRPGIEIEEIGVTRDTYYQVTAGETVMRVGTHQGRYGFEWIKAYQTKN